MANATRLQIGTYSVLVTRKRMKNLYLRVLPQEGICVSAPLRTTDAEISRFVLSRADWIEKQLAHDDRDDRVRQQVGQVAPVDVAEHPGGL